MEQPHSQPAGQHAARLQKIRQARRARRTRGILLCLLAALLCLLGVSGAYSSSLALAGDLWDSIRISMTPGPGFPQKTGLGEIYQVEELAGGFAALARQDLVLYAPSGRRLRSIQHGDARPVIAVGGRRVCLYNRSGYEVRIESRSKTLYTKTFEEPVLLCAMSRGGSLAVVTRSARYAAELTVYSPGMNFRYGWNPTENEGIPIRVAFAADNRRLAVACLSARDGQVCTGLYWLDTRSDQVTASASAPGSTPLQLHWLNNDELLAIFDDHAAIYQAATGAETARYSYGGQTLVSASVSGYQTALLLGERKLVLLGRGLSPAAEITLPAPAGRVVCSRTAAYSLENEAVRCFDLKGQQQWVRQLDTPPDALLNANQLLLFSAGEVRELTAPSGGASAGEDASSRGNAPDEGNTPGEQDAAPEGDTPDGEGK